MVKKFKFYIDNDICFECPLESNRCMAENNDGDQCKRRTVIGTGICWIHLLKFKHLRILNNAHGKGLYAMDLKKEPIDIIFRENEVITEYNGELINTATLTNRYQDKTAPYAAKRLGNNKFEDGACKRGVGSIINHGNSRQANARLSFSHDGTLKIRATKNITNGSEILINYNIGRGGRRYIINQAGVRHTTK